MSLRMMTSFIVAMLAACPVQGQSTVSVPDEATGQTGEFLIVEATCREGTAVSWYAPDKGLTLIPPRLLRDQRATVCMAIKPGRYRLVCFAGTSDGESVTLSGPHLCMVVIGDPEPDDPLLASLREAFDSETPADRKKQLAKLAELYRQAGDVARRPDVDTAGKLFAVLKKAASELGLSGALPRVQTVIQRALTSVLPTDPAAGFDPALAVAHFGRIADALEKINDDE